MLLPVCESLLLPLQVRDARFKAEIKEWEDAADQRVPRFVERFRVLFEGPPSVTQLFVRLWKSPSSVFRVVPGQGRSPPFPLLPPLQARPDKLPDDRRYGRPHATGPHPGQYESRSGGRVPLAQEPGGLCFLFLALAQLVPSSLLPPPIPFAFVAHLLFSSPRPPLSHSSA